MRRLLIIVLIVVVLLTVVWYFFLVSPIQDRKADAEQGLAAAQDEELLLRTQLARLRKIQENELQYRSAIGELEAAIPPTPQLDQLIDDLKVLADESGVLWLSGSYALPTEIEGTDMFSVGMSLSIEGQFFEVLGYLYGIAEMDRLVRIDTVGLSPGEDEFGFTQITAAISAVTFTTAEVALPEIDLEALFPTSPEEEQPEPEPAEEEPAGDGGAGEETTTTTTTEGGGE